MNRIEHTINLDFTNAFGKHIYVVDCPHLQSTVAVEYGNAGTHETYCTCGIRL